MELLPVGSRIEISRSAPAIGTWPRYQGRRGFIVAVNKEMFPDGSQYVEYGVHFIAGGDFSKNWRADAWFKPSEIKPVPNTFKMELSF